MKLALITNNKPHHKYFINELFKKYEVELIIIPNPIKAESLAKRIRAKRPFLYGFGYFLLKLLSILFNNVSRYSIKYQLKSAEKDYFPGVIQEYINIPEEIIHTVDTINNEYCINLIKQKSIDILCFLGGDIARKEIIGSANICALNFHSGISPFYNGTKTTFHAVKDLRPNFTGGTLMYITERIDGGKILSHYFPEIDSNDKAADLFMKGITGAVKLYIDFLDYIKNKDLPEGVEQRRSFRYVRNIDWSITDDLKLKGFEKSNRVKIYSRKEKIITYYHLNKDQIDELYRISLSFILNKK